MFRRFFALAVLLCLLCAGGAVGTLAWADKQAGDRIAQGVTVQGVDVGGLTVAQAQARLQRRIADPALAPVVVTLDGKPHSLDARRAGVQVDVAGAAMQAAAEGRGDGFITRGWRELKGGGVDADIPLTVRVKRGRGRPVRGRTGQGRRPPRHRRGLQRQRRERGHHRGQARPPAGRPRGAGAAGSRPRCAPPAATAT